MHAGWRLPWEAVDVADAAHRLRHRSEARTVRVGTRLSVAGDSAQYEPRVHLAEPLPTEVPLLERAGAKVLDEYIAHPHEVQQ
jgi:hypothetical protein